MDQGVTKGTEGAGFICAPCFTTANAKVCAVCSEAITSGKTLQGSDGSYYHETCWGAHQAAGGNKSRSRTDGGQNKLSTDQICTGCGLEIRSNSHKVSMLWLPSVPITVSMPLMRTVNPNPTHCNALLTPTPPL
jgi:hypothetical protein